MVTGAYARGNASRGEKKDHGGDRKPSRQIDYMETSEKLKNVIRLDKNFPLSRRVVSKSTAIRSSIQGKA
jgi:hypothetical protein